MLSSLRVGALGVLLAAAGPALAQPAPAVAPATAPSVVIEHPWARPTAPRQSVGAAYMLLRSPGGDRLLGGSSPVAARVELHETRMEGDVMRMRAREVLDLPPGQAVTLAPGGLHVMLIGLAEPLAAGQRVPLTLRFERGGEQQVEVVVGGAEGAGAPARTAQ